VRRIFGRVLLPEDADTSSARVEYADGLLRVVFAKLSEDDKKKAALAIELDAEHAGLEQEVSSRLDKVKELRAKLEAEVAEAAKAEESLRRARAEALQRPGQAPCVQAASCPYARGSIHRACAP
jgi:C4-dicarboxylate-specific signal transduction histidine kinase